MHASAQQEIVEYLTEFEGPVPFMYLDRRGLVTTGIGALIDPIETHLHTVSWRDKKTKASASDADVTAEFNLVKSKAVNGQPAPGFESWKAFENITQLRISDDDMKKAVLKHVSTDEANCRQFFKGYDGYPADVQVLLVQMSYAGGLIARKDDLAPLLAAHDWQKAVKYAYLTNPTMGRDAYRKYNWCFKQLLLNAHVVESCSKLASPNPKMPTDIKEFFGYKNALSVRRAGSTLGPGDFFWDFDSDLMNTKIWDTDIITRGNVLIWLRKQG